MCVLLRGCDPSRATWVNEPTFFVTSSWSLFYTIYIYDARSHEHQLSFVSVQRRSLHEDLSTFHCCGRIKFPYTALLCNTQCFYAAASNNMLFNITRITHCYHFITNSGYWTATQYYIIRTYLVIARNGLDLCVFQCLSQLFVNHLKFAPVLSAWLSVLVC
jgi:hypothetical protein